MNTHFHILLAQSRADDLHRAAAISRLAQARPPLRARLRSSRGYTAVARRVWALRGAPGLVP